MSRMPRSNLSRRGGFRAPRPAEAAGSSRGLTSHPPLAVPTVSTVDKMKGFPPPEAAKRLLNIVTSEVSSGDLFKAAGDIIKERQLSETTQVCLEETEAPNKDIVIKKVPAIVDTCDALKLLVPPGYELKKLAVRLIMGGGGWLIIYSVMAGRWFRFAANGRTHSFTSIDEVYDDCTKKIKDLGVTGKPIAILMHKVTTQEKTDDNLQRKCSTGLKNLQRQIFQRVEEVLPDASPIDLANSHCQTYNVKPGPNISSVHPITSTADGTVLQEGTAVIEKLKNLTINWLEEVIEKRFADMTLDDNTKWKTKLSENGGEIRDHGRSILLCYNAVYEKIFVLPLPMTAGQIGRSFCIHSDSTTPFCVNHTDEKDDLCAQHIKNELQNELQIQLGEATNQSGSALLTTSSVKYNKTDYIKRVRMYIVKDKDEKSKKLITKSDLDKLHKDIREKQNVILVDNLAILTTDNEDIIVYGLVTRRSKKKLCMRDGCTTQIAMAAKSCPVHRINPSYFALDLIDEGRPKKADGKPDKIVHYIEQVTTDLVDSTGRPNRLELTLRDRALVYKCKQSLAGHTVDLVLYKFKAFPTKELAVEQTAAWQFAALLRSLLDEDFGLINKKCHFANSGELIRQALVEAGISVEIDTLSLPPTMSTKWPFILVQGEDRKRIPSSYAEGRKLSYHTYAAYFEDNTKYTGHTSDSTKIMEYHGPGSRLFDLEKFTKFVRVTSLSCNKEDALCTESLFIIVDMINLVIMKKFEGNVHSGNLNAELQCGTLERLSLGEAKDAIGFLFYAETGENIVIKLNK